MNEKLEAKIEKLLTEELTKSDVIKTFKTEKECEKFIRKIVADVVVDMFRVLWQHNNIFKTLGK